MKLNPRGKPPRPSPWKSPWILECAAFVLVVFQEDYRLECRTIHRTLPIAESLQNFYYFNFGDFSNGFINAFVIDGLVDTVFLPLAATRFPKLPVVLSVRIRTVIACLISAIIIVVFEVRQNAFTQADLADIPAGVAGAVVYLGARFLALYLRRRW